MDTATADPRAAEQARDRGLLRSVGTWGFAFAIINGVVGAGIFSLPAEMAGSAGAAAPWVYLAVAIVMAAVVVCFAEASSRVPTSGGSYGFVAAAFGPGAGFVAGMLVWVSSVLACGGIAAAFADGLAASVPLLREPGMRELLIAVVIGGLAAVNMTGAAPATRFISVTTAAKLVPLGLFVAAGAWLLASFGAAAAATAVPGHDLGSALVLALFAFCGMETPLSASGEVSAPERTIPRALFLGMGFIAILYISLQLVAQALLGAGLAGSATPLADAIGRRLPALGPVLLLGATFSRLIWIASDLFGAPRILFAFARDGLLAGWLGRVSARGRVPANAIALHALLAAGFALTGTFRSLAILSTLATAALYALAAAAAWRLQRRAIALFGRPLTFRALPAAAVLAIASMAAVILVRLLAAPAEVAGLAAVIGGSLALYAVRRPGGAPEAA